MARTPDPVDIHVGARLRRRRTLLGLSQTMLGEMLGLTFQQVQKYESGANRIGAGRLYEIGRILDVPVTYFFEDLPERPAKERRRPGRPRRVARDDGDPLARRETLELVRAYYRIDDRRVRECLREMIKALPAATRRGRTSERAPDATDHPRGRRPARVSAALFDDR